MNFYDNIKTILNFIDYFNNPNDQIIISPCKQYYTHKGIHYDIAFPLFWVLTENDKCGPNNCDDCKKNGTFRGVFIMYCTNCAVDYDLEVGYGAVEPGVENGGLYINKTAWYTYLKHRNLKYIGLPEELNKIDFDRPGFSYTLKNDIGENGTITRLYPDFIPNDDNLMSEYEEDSDFESDTTEINN
jgi:hypothetical protein